MAPRILALDIGTTSTKGLLVDAWGGTHGLHTVGYQTSRPHPGHAEQDPVEILSAVRATIATLAPMDVDLVFSSAMHSLIGVDANGQPLTPMWTWADQRSGAIAAELRAGPDAEQLHARTGTPLHPMSPLCKIRYLRGAEPDLFRRIARFVSIKEYVIESLLGARCVDHSVASSTGLLDVPTREWNARALELAGIDASALSPLVPTTHVLEDGPGKRRVVVGATDGVLANLGVAPEAGREGVRMACLTLGTSGAARLTVDAPVLDPRGRLFCYVLDAKRHVIGGAVNNGGLVLRWLRDLFSIPETAAGTAAFMARVESVPLGAEGLLCIPELTGERYPSYRSTGGGRFHGLNVAHRAEHLQRAGIEGMMLAFAPLVAELEQQSGGAPLTEVRIGGGMFGWEFCRQLLADITGRRVRMPASVESSALGAARLGFAALGIPADWAMEFPHVHEPDTARHTAYQDILARRVALQNEHDSH